MCLTLCRTMNCSTTGFPVLHYLLEFAQTHVHWGSDSIQPSHPLSLPSPLALNLSQLQGLFQWVCSSHQVAKVLSFSFSITPSDEDSRFISLRIDWFDLLAVQGTLKSLLQHHNLKASVLQHSAFFTVQLSHPYMTTGKTIALTIWTFVGKVLSLLFCGHILQICWRTAHKPLCKYSSGPFSVIVCSVILTKVISQSSSEDILQ